MISRIQARDLINSEEFVREPVNEICDKINESKNNKIILEGTRGCGKSTVLYNLKYSSINTKNPTIYTLFDPVILFSKSNEKYFNYNFKKQYYELRLCFRLLGFIKKYYGLVYEKYFKEIYIELEKYSTVIDEIINNSFYKNTECNELFELTEPTLRIIDKLKEVLKLESLNISFDRFDWVNGSDPVVQQILSEYFDLFDKVILTTDDECINEKKTELEKKGYSFETIDYAKNEIVIKQIIKSRLNNNKEKTIFKEEYITDKIYSDLIEKTNGNITLLFDIVRDVIGLCDWNNKTDDIENLFYVQSEYELKKEKQFKKLYNNPNLYL